MSPDKTTRRGFLGGMFAAVCAWLCPRPPQAAAASRLPTPPAALRPSERSFVTSYTYDGMGRLLSMTEHLPLPYQPSLYSPDMMGQTTTYTYSS